MSESDRSFKDVVQQRTVLPAAPIDVYLQELDAFIAAHDYFAQDRIIPAIGRGAASRDVVGRGALESYYLGRWMTPELALLVANAPDVHSFTLEDSTHYRHWAQTFAGETGYLRDPNHVQMKIEWCRQLGLSDADIRAYTPLPETIAMVCTMLFYVRRSYEEGLAVFGYAGGGCVTAGSGYARTLSDGLRTHYGITVRTFEAHADAEPEHGDKASDLFRLVATTRSVQDRCREAVRNFVLTAECRVHAMNRWLE